MVKLNSTMVNNTPFIYTINPPTPFALMFSDTTSLQFQNKFPKQKMMIGETHRHHQSHVPPWQLPEPITTLPKDDLLASLRRYLVSTSFEDADFSGDFDFPAEDDDEFFMYEFKVRKCTRARAHDWTECPFAHPGEKARRRDPRKYSYSGTACSDFRKGGCKKGDGCEFAHGVFECWLHPSRYRTQACKDGPGCKRRVCFFAHSPDQIRAGSGLVGSPRSDSSDGVGSVGDLVASLRNLQLNKVKSMPTSSVWGVGSPVFGSPRGGSVSRAGFLSLPTTPTRPGIGLLDWGDNNNNNKKGEGEEGGVVMERVESGRELRARMFEKLSKENPLNGPSPVAGLGPAQGPDLGWVSDLIT